MWTVPRIAGPARPAGGGADTRGSTASVKGTAMRIPAGLCFLACCCAVLAACTAAGPVGPKTIVRTPSVGRPQPPASAQAALSQEAFTSYAALGLADDDGLAPGESQFSLGGACMTAAGYPAAGAGGVPQEVSLGLAGLAFALPWGGWGYLGAAEAQQYGFRNPPGSVMNALDTGFAPVNPASFPLAEQAASGKCATIVQDFGNAMAGGPLAGIGILGDDISTDVLQDAAVKAATRIWSACMAKNGYSFGAPLAVYPQERQAMYGTGPIVIGAAVSTAAQHAQLAAAATDADCSQSSDLAGIYFAVQASYEQQLVTANQQALSDAARQYRAAYARELSKLAALLRTAKAQPFGPAKHPRASA
jgi:hypothetical protein